MTRPEIVAWLQARGYRQNPTWPHIFTQPSKLMGEFITIRYKVRTRTLQREVKRGEFPWAKSGQATYFSKLSLSEDGRLVGYGRG